MQLCEFEHGAALKLITGLQPLRNIKGLNIRHCGLETEVAEAIADSLPDLSIERVAMDFNYFGEEGIARILEASCESTHLASLSIHNSNPDNCEYYTNGLPVGMSKGSLVPAIIEMVSKMKNLRGIKISCETLDSVNYTLLSQALKENANLSYLNLGPLK